MLPGSRELWESAGDRGGPVGTISERREGFYRIKSIMHTVSQKQNKEINFT